MSKPHSRNVDASATRHPHSNPSPRPSTNGRPPVLVVLHPDGYVETYCRDADVVVVVMPSMESADGERLADEFLASSLPKRHRSIYAPGLIAATGQVETIRPSEIIHRNMMRGLVRALTAMTNQEVTSCVI